MAAAAALAASRHAHKAMEEEEDERRRLERERKKEKKLKKLEEDGDLDAYKADKERRKKEKAEKMKDKKNKKEKESREERRARQKEKKHKKEEETDEDNETGDTEVPQENGEEEPLDELPEETVERIRDARQNLAFVTKFNYQQFDQIEESDLLELFEVLDPDTAHAEQGVKMSLLHYVLTSDDLLLQEPIGSDEALQWFGSFVGEDAEDEDPLIRAPDLYAVLHDEETMNTFNMRRSTFKREQEEAQQAQAKLQAIAETEVNRQDLVQHVVYTVTRDDAFLTLPFTLVYIIIFIFLVNSHLGIYQRQLMEKSLEDWLNGREVISQADLNVDDLASFWEWAIEVGIPAPLGEYKDESSTDGNSTRRQYWLASRHILVGDVRMKMTDFDDNTEIKWLLQQDVAKQHLATPEGEGQHKEAAILAAKELKNGTWSSANLHKIWLSFVTYDELAEAFAITTAYVRVDEYGSAEPVMNSGSIYMNPYGSGSTMAFIILFDVFFICLVGKMFFSEAKDALLSLKLGCDEFRDYWQIWNIVDWCSILLSFCCVILWCSVLIGTTDATLTGLLDDNGELKKDVMDLSAEDLDYIYAMVSDINQRYMVLHVVMAINTCAIVMKFFKAFQSNPRLKVVTDTFVQAATDLAHFFIIFLTLFMPFTIIGHILFGKDIPEMGSVMASVNTGIALLMGEFGWYVDNSPEHIGSQLPSGMPTLVLFIWFFLFNFMMVLVVLNMLLAVILEHYTKVTEQLEHTVDAPPIWVQVTRYLHFKRATRGFVSFEQMARMLENDDDAAHPEPVVTTESLIKAFESESMTAKQGQWMMNFLQEQVYKHKQKDEGMEEEEANRSTQEQILEVVTENSERLDEIKNKLAELPNSGIGKKLEELLSTVQDLKTEQKKLRAKLDDHSSSSSRKK